MHKIQQSESDLEIVQIAKKIDSLPELCNLVEYHPDFGMVEPYWHPKWEIRQLVRHLNREK